MIGFVTVLVLVATGALGQNDSVEPTGPTPAPYLPCDNSLCTGKPTGNYAIEGAEHHFVRCHNGMAYCEACWPENLYYSAVCDQCLHTNDDVCYTTQTANPDATLPTFTCPEICTAGYTGNMADPTQARHFVSCREGVKVGCTVCPAGLLYNEAEDKCLWEGIHFTQPNA